MGDILALAALYRMRGSPNGRLRRFIMTTADWQAGGFGIYVHWPFCLAKCPYCDFNSHVSRAVDHTAWRAALVREARQMRALTGARRADTVFFGGGTPSLMEPETVAAVLDEIDQLWGLAAGAEITLEANPTSAEAENFRGYAAAGVNRLSMGIQALNDADLRALGRQHTVAEAEQAFTLARALFERVSFDLIYARVGQRTADWEAELTRALDMAIDHLSLYQLTIEPGTRFAELHARGRLAVPGDGLAAEMYELTQAITTNAGMSAYEISNHARPGAESRHNLIYWRYGDYAGIGPGAHGRITDANGVRHAMATLRQPGAWLTAINRDGQAVAEEVELSAQDQATEYLMMAMRLAEGADLKRYVALSGTRPDALADLSAMGLIEVEADQIRATQTGRVVLNTVIGEMLA